MVYVPHPFDPMRRNLAEPALVELVAAGLVDAIEVFNAKTSLRHLNDRAAEFAERQRPRRRSGQRRPRAPGPRLRLRGDARLRRPGGVPGQPSPRQWSWATTSIAPGPGRPASCRPRRPAESSRLRVDLPRHRPWHRAGADRVPPDLLEWSPHPRAVGPGLGRLRGQQEPRQDLRRRAAHRHPRRGRRLLLDRSQDLRPRRHPQGPPPAPARHPRGPPGVAAAPVGGAGGRRRSAVRGAASTPGSAPSRSSACR